MKKKICFIVSHPGTASSFLKLHMQCLKDDFEVHLVANFTKEDEKQLLFDGVICHAVKIERKINLVSDLRTVCKLLKLFKKECFFSIHSVTPKAGLVTAIAGKLTGIKNRIHIYTGQVWATRIGVMRYILMGFDKLIAICNTRLFVDGKSQRSFLIQNGILNETNSVVVGEGSICGVDIKRFAPSKEVRNDIRKELKLHESRVVYMFLGRLNHDKGIGDLLEAFNRLATDDKEPYLLLVGADEEGYDQCINDFCNIKRGENYCFYGSTPQPERLLQAADAFVLPTYREGFGSSVIEASCEGIPVICSDVYGVMDAMIDNVTGLRCKVGNVDTLYSCMKQLYDDSSLRFTLGANGRKRVLEKFASDIITKAWLDFYRHL